jgi:hypothetical protein
MSSVNQAPNRLLKFFKISTIAAVVSVLFLIISGFIVLRRDIANSEYVAVLGLAIPLIIGGIGQYLEYKSKISKKQSFAITLGLLVLTLIIAFATVNFSFNLTIENLPDFRFILFSIMFILSIFLSVPLFSLIKTLKQKQKQEQAKNTDRIRVGISAFSLIILFLVTGLVGVSINQLYIPNVKQGVGYTIGPWATFHDNTENSITITWLTKEKNSTVLFYGTDPLNLNLKFQRSENVYLHKAILTGLSPNTTYYYRIPETFVNDHQSTLFRFKTGSSDTTKFKFAVFGDKQPTNDRMLETNRFVVDGIIQGNYDFALQTGDLASAGTSKQDWYMVLQSLGLLGATTPLQMAIGNHDWNGISGATNWRALFSYPYPNSEGANYYSFDYGNAHFVMIDNFEIFYRMSDTQIKWIEKDLMDAKARGKIWTFAFFHLSIFTTATSGFYEDLKATLLPIFDKTGVDAVFYGHDHHYEYLNYTYGANGLVFSPDHTWKHNPVQYFCTGGGGANLEVDYGVLNMPSSLYQLKWYNTATSQYENRYYAERAWNSSRYVTHPSFERNYTQYSPNGEHDGKYYYHAPEIESYSNSTSEFGFVYGEQTYQFMEIVIDGNTCIIRALYPNRQLLTGPGGLYPQEITIVK